METVIPLAAAINATLLAAALGAQAWRTKARAGGYAAAFLAISAAAIGLIAAEHGGHGLSPGASSVIEGALTFFAGPVFLLFTVSAIGRTADRRVLSIALALTAGSAAAALSAYPLTLVADRLTLAQMGFTVWAAIIVARFEAPNRRAVRVRNCVVAAIAVLAVVHAAQLVRSFWPQIDLFRNIVPFVGSAGLFLLTGAVYFGGRLGLLQALTEPPPVATDDMRTLIARFEGALSAGLIKDAGLTQQAAAAILGTSSDRLGDALRAVTGAGFSSRLQQLRVEEAQRLLADPKEVRTSMEAIGLLAGFGSRSAFYKAFGEQVGVAPAAYRRAIAENPVQKADSGHN
jgi:AraC-like DNA-binding protein